MNFAETVDHLELIMFSGLIAVFVFATVAAVVGALTLILTREHAADLPPAPATATPKPAAARGAHAPEAATAIAG